MVMSILTSIPMQTELAIHMRIPMTEQKVMTIHIMRDRTAVDCGGCQGGDCKNETVALLTYMLQHNEHHAAELDQMADNLAKMGMDAAAKTIKESVSDFQKGNMRLGLALTLVKEEMK